MTQCLYQAILAQLVVDPDFRDRVRRDGGHALPTDLTQIERERLVTAACDPGIEISRTLHKGFRLGKLLSLLPLSYALLGDSLFSEEVGSFWHRRPAMSFYYLEEAIAFCDHLLDRIAAGLDTTYLSEVVTFELAGLQLQRDFVPGESSESKAVAFRHDPFRMLNALARGQHPAAIPIRPCSLLARLDEEGRLHWSIVENGETPCALQSDVPGSPAIAERLH